MFVFLYVKESSGGGWQILPRTGERTKERKKKEKQNRKSKVLCLFVFPKSKGEEVPGIVGIVLLASNFHRVGREPRNFNWLSLDGGWENRSTTRKRYERIGFGVSQRKTMAGD